MPMTRPEQLCFVKLSPSVKYLHRMTWGKCLGIEGTQTGQGGRAPAGRAGPGRGTMCHL